MYKEITRADAVDGKIYLIAVSFAAQMLYKIISDDNCFTQFERVKDNELALEILCGDFCIIKFEAMGLREYIYTAEQGVYICTFATTIIFPIFFDTETFEEVKEDRKTKLKGEQLFVAMFSEIMLGCLKKFDKKYTEKCGKIREDVPLRAEVE